MNINLNAKQAYFAAANTFSGFRSFFNDAFNSYDHTRIFVLKGGPGTGKSSLMKKVAAFAESSAIKYELFYCSSDPNSLDGVTLYTDNGRVSVLDGTAPHERDAVLPGAVDELVNLGEAWDSVKLISHKDEIEYLNKRKSHSYKSAYSELSISAVYWTKYKAEIYKSVDMVSLNETANQIIERLGALKKGKTDIRLLSSFSKNGYSQLPYKSKFKKILNLNGDNATKYILLTEISELLQRKGSKFIKILSPLDTQITEAIILDNDTLLTTDKGDNSIFDATSLCDISDNTKLQLTYYAENINKHLDIAKKHLTQASEYHFALEAIYTPCMDFSILDSITDKTISKIKAII